MRTRYWLHTIKWYTKGAEQSRKGLVLESPSGRLIQGSLVYCFLFSSYFDTEENDNSFTKRTVTDIMEWLPMKGISWYPNIVVMVLMQRSWYSSVGGNKRRNKDTSWAGGFYGKDIID